MGVNRLENAFSSLGNSDYISWVLKVSAIFGSSTHSLLGVLEMYHKLLNTFNKFYI